MEKATIFRIINQLEYEFITCVKCKDLLNAPIFTFESKHYCENCWQVHIGDLALEPILKNVIYPCEHEECDFNDEFPGVERHLKNCYFQQFECTYCRNYALEHILMNMIYPCAHEGCDFLGVSAEVAKHMENCYFHQFECKFCLKPINESGAIEHLKQEHQDIVDEMVLEDPEVTLPFISEPSVKIYLLTLQMHTFAAITYLAEDGFKFHIAKTRQHETDVIDKYQIQYGHDSFELSLKGVVCNMRQMLGRSGKDALKAQNCDVRPSSDIENFTIYFNDYNMMKDIVNTCPICLHAISATFYQCVNNHSVCVSCRPKMRTCPTCRGRMQDILVDLKFTLSKVPYNCTNSSLGCIQFISSEHIKDHLKMCAFQSVACDECKNWFAKCNIVSHMSAHDGVIKNFDCTDIVGLEDAYRGKSRYTFMICENNVFKFTMNVAKSMPHRLCFNVQLLYCTDENHAQQYRYVAQLLADPKDLFGQFNVENFCQTCEDKDPSSSIPFSTLRSYLNNNIVKFRFYVYRRVM